MQIDISRFGKSCEFSPEAIDALKQAFEVLEKNEET